MDWCYSHSELISLKEYFEEIFDCHQVLLEPTDIGFIIHRRWFEDGKTIKYSYTSWFNHDLDRALNKIRGNNNGLG